MSEWSENVSSLPKELSNEEFDPRERAYPFADTDGKGFIGIGYAGVRFVGQRGPIKECGINGCQIDDMILFAKKTIEHFNRKFPCSENNVAIDHLAKALEWLALRRANREDRGVEGFGKA